MVGDILKQILHINIKDMHFEKNINLNNISEYKFEAFKLKAKLEDEKEIEMYLKIVKNSKIKESIFCYWCLIYEEELLKINSSIGINNYTNKVLITELTKKKYYQSIFLEIENNTYKILEGGTEINFVNIKKFIIDMHLEDKYKKLLECFEQQDGYELLVGIKNTK